MNTTLLINPTAFEAGLLSSASATGLTGAREAAWAAFAQTGLPHRRLEAWKWTDLRAALREPLAQAPANDVIAPSPFDGFEIALLNGAAQWSGDAPEGVEITSVAAEAAAPCALASDHPLANLVCALTTDVVHIAVAAGRDIGRPLLIRHVAGAGQAHARILIDVGDGAQVSIIETFEGPPSSGGDAYFSNSFTEARLGAGARLTRSALQEGDASGVEANLFAATLGVEAHVEQTALAFGGKAVRLETRLAYEGDGAGATLNSAAMLSGVRHADVTSHIAHHAEGCVTRQTHKAAVKARGRGVFQGKFYVARGAQKTDADMQANALLLSDTAEANHKPELEIYADDVECAHGSTAGALDENALFYLRQRGLDEAAARALLIEAFLGAVIDGVADEAVRDIFRARTARWLEDA